jgi:tetratricopeptide (TPR) repeat protein
MTKGPSRSLRCWAVLAIAVGTPGCATGGSVREIAPAPALAPSEVEQVQRTMAWRLVDEGDYDRALPLLRDLLAQYPRDAGLRLLLGIVLREKQMYGPALAELKLVVGWRPDSARAHAALGVLLDQMGRHGEAEKHHRQAVALRPSMATYHNNLGFCLFLSRRRPEAKEALERAIRLDPSLRRAYNNLGFLRGLDDDEDAALRAFRQAGSPAMAWTNMGLVAELRGRPQHARACYERALREQPDFAPALRNLRALDPQSDAGARGSRPDDGVAGGVGERASRPWDDSDDGGGVNSEAVEGEAAPDRPVDAAPVQAPVEAPVQAPRGGTTPTAATLRRGGGERP